MSITLINTASINNTGAGLSTQSLPATSLTTGNLIIVGFRTSQFFAAAPTGTISDTAGNNYVLATSKTDGNTAWSAVYLYYCENAIGHASNVVTVTYSGGNSNNSGIFSAQYSGVALTGSKDTTNATNSGSTSSTSFTSGAFTTTQSDELIIAVGYSISATSFTAGTGYFLQKQAGVIAYEDKIVSSIQTGITASMSCNNSNIWAFLVTTFKAAAAVEETDNFTDTITFSDGLQLLLDLPYSFSDSINFTDFIFPQLSSIFDHSGTATITYGFDLSGVPNKEINSATVLIDYNFSISGHATKALSATCIITYEIQFDIIGQSNAVDLGCITGTDELPSENTETVQGNYAYFT